MRGCRRNWIRLLRSLGWMTTKAGAARSMSSCGSGSGATEIPIASSVPTTPCRSRIASASSWRAADADPRVGIACPQYPDPFVARLSRWRGVYPEAAQPQAAGTAQEVDVPHGTLMLVRRECLDEIGLFDQRYFAYGDEHDLGARAVRQGWKVVLVWGSIVTNPATWTESSWRSYLVRPQLALSRPRLFRSHRGRHSRDSHPCQHPAIEFAQPRRRVRLFRPGTLESGARLL